ncbi:2-polyprenyl-3-methyl-5-hydroxy-6-metoxy-1,4-benzoquinol methylase [Bradyrhizobium sp. LM3.2]
MSMQQDTSATASPPPGSTVDAAEIAKFSKLSAEWWDPNGKMAPLHRINPLRLGYIRDAACRKFERNLRSLNCLGGLRVLDIGCGAGLLCEPLSRLGAQVIGVDPSVSNIAAAKLHADKAHLCRSTIAAPRWKRSTRASASISCWPWRWSSTSSMSAFS